MKVCHQCGSQYDGEQSFCPRDGEVLQDDHAEMIGRILDGQYQIEEFIAEGGMGAVYKARHTLLGDKVAIKILPPEMRRNAAWLKRFQREGQAARRFHHPNSVIVHDLRTSSEGEIYLVMELVEGRTLDAEVAARGGHLSLAEALQIIEPVASVLDAAHAMGVVHRDLKPSNIMISDRGIVKLLDLGVAKVSDLGAGVTSLTVTGQLLGTPYFMSPEQWGELPRDGSEEIDGRTDVYSLGVVTYQLTTGEFPFSGTSIVSLRRAHCHEVPRPLEEFDASIPQGWSQAVLRAMSKDRGDRQQTAGEFAGELRASIGGVDVRYESGRAVMPTLVSQPQQTTSPNAYSTPQNLNADTITSSDKTQNVQPTAAPNFHPAPLPIESRQPAKSKWLLMAIASILILAIGVFAFWQWRGNTRARRRTTNVQANNSTEIPAETPTESQDASVNQSPPTTLGHDAAVPADGTFMRYALLVSHTALDSQRQMSGRDSIAPGEGLQFMFKTYESGYLYMIGQDPAGEPAAMPLGDTEAMATATAGQETTLPAIVRIRTDLKPGTENFTVIFTDKPLALPFAAEMLPLDGSFRKLTMGERREIEELRKQSAPVTIQYEDDKAIVKLEAERGSRPVVFDIKLELQRP